MGTLIGHPGRCAAPRALVLVAGTGRRLQPETLDRPKCLVEIGGTPLLAGLLAGLADAGVVDVTLVIGYLGTMVRAAASEWTPAAMRISWEENPFFFRTNTLSSVATAAGRLHGQPFLLVNGDLWIRPGQLRRLVRGPDRFAMLIDPGVDLDDEAMKVALDEAGTVCAVSKTLPIAAASGEAIGAYRFDADTGRRFLDDVRWRHSQGDVTSFYEASFDRLFREGARAEAIGVDPLAWVEIDDHADLARARACMARDSGRDEAGRVVAHG